MLVQIVAEYEGDYFLHCLLANAQVSELLVYTDIEQRRFITCWIFSQIKYTDITGELIFFVQQEKRFGSGFGEICV